MTDPLDIHHQRDEGHGRYFARLPSGEEAEMTYRLTAPGVIAIDHTMVPEVFRGHGIAQRLVERGIADARAEGLKIVPLCSYVAVQFRRHKEWADLLAT